MELMGRWLTIWLLSLHAVLTWPGGRTQCTFLHYVVVVCRDCPVLPFVVLSYLMRGIETVD